ncbi:MAG: TetR/AcrR family transcriptional regulator [Chloroflexi bacterium]|nr:MAG: TetR/AcrR family transcriptional regulator [Chloroflexota bacterium]
MPKLKPEEIALRRREIVDAARTCFVRSGFHRTTTDEICREANITPGGLYHYFANKEEIIKAVIRDQTENALTVMHNTAAESPDPRAALRSVGLFFLQAMLEPGFDNVARLDIETWSEGLRRPDLLKIIQEGREATLDAVTEVIQEAVRRGNYSAKVDPEALANLFSAIYAGLRISKLLVPHRVDAPAVLDALRMMIRGEILGSASSLADEQPSAAEIVRPSR